MPKILAFPLIALILCGCPPESESKSTANVLLKCWNARPFERGMFVIDFEAMVFPRHGVLAYTANCPDVRLNLVFKRTSKLPSKFDPLRKANESIMRYGIKGRAVVSIDNSSVPPAPAVFVSHLVVGRLLTSQETTRLNAEMDKIR